MAGADGTALPLPARCPSQPTAAAGVVLNQIAETEEKLLILNHRNSLAGKRGSWCLGGVQGKPLQHNFYITCVPQWSFLGLVQLEK